MKVRFTCDGEVTISRVYRDGDKIRVVLNLPTGCKNLDMVLEVSRQLLFTSLQKRLEVEYASLFNEGERILRGWPSYEKKTVTFIVERKKNGST